MKIFLKIQSYLFIICFSFIFFSCENRKEKELINLQQLNLDKLFTENSTYGDETLVYTHDSLFCIYQNEVYFKVWLNGSLLKEKNDILPLIKNNNSNKIFRTYKFQSQLMRLDFNKYTSKVIDWITKHYQIRKNGNAYFILIKGYQECKLPVKHYESMDWITFNSMDIDNDKIPELFIFTESYDAGRDNEYGKMEVYKIN